MTYKVAKDTTDKAGLQKPRLFRRIVFKTDKEISWTTHKKKRLLPPTRKDKPNKQMGMQIKCNNCLWQHLVRKIFIYVLENSWKNVKTHKGEVTKSTLTHIFQNAAIAPLACPWDTPPHLHRSTVHEGQLRTPTLFMPHLHAPSLWFKELPEELLNIKTFGNGLSITQSAAFRSWKNPNKCSQTLEHYILHHKTSKPFKDFPWLDSLLNCFIHRPQKER